MKQFLETPVLVGDVLLAPTTELAGLAELASLSSFDDKLDALVRIAESIQAEDQARDHISRLRARPHLVPLPQRHAAAA